MAREPLRSVDAAWLRMDRVVNTADVVAVLRLDGGVSMARLRDLLETRLLVRPRFRQRIVRGPIGGPAWEDDPRFSLERHVVEARLGGEVGAFEAYVSAIASEPLDLRRPPWRMHLLHAPRGSTIVAKLHHCIADGFALVAVLLSLADGAAPRGAPLRPREPSARSPETDRTGGLLAPAILPAALARMIVLPPDPATALKRPLRGERRVAFSRPFSRSAVRAAARARGVTGNVILNAALAGALRRWLLESGGSVPPRDLRALVPVNLRSPGAEESLGNEFGLVYLELPTASGTSEERVQRVHARMEALKAGPDAIVTYGVLSVLGRLPIALQQVIDAFFTTKASLVVTNLPGPRRALRLAGRRLEHLMFWVPHPASLGLGVSIIRYAGEVVVGVRADAAVMPDPARLVRLFEAELRGLLRPAPARRRSGGGERRVHPRPGAQLPEMPRVPGPYGGHGVPLDQPGPGPYS